MHAHPPPLRAGTPARRTSLLALAAFLGLSLVACNAAPAHEPEDELGELSQALRRRPPHQPTAPSFTDVSQTSVRVSWAAGRFATGSELERAPDGGGAPGAFAAIAFTDASSHVDAGLAAGTTYWYRVRSSNEFGSSSYSTPARVTTLASAAPAPPPVAVAPEPAPPPPSTTTPPPPPATTAPRGATLREAAARHGILFGMGWGPPPWTTHEGIASSEFNTYSLPGTVGVIWKGPGQYDWWSPDIGVQYAVRNPAFRYASAQLFYGVFLGANNNELVPAWLRWPDSSTRYGAPRVSPEQLSQHMRDFLIAYVQRYGTGCERTEIANELVTDPHGDWYYMNSSIGYAGGRSVAQYIDQLARWAKAANPNVKLFVNDNRNEDSQTISGVANAFGALLRTLREMGSPIDGAGFQCHQLREIPYNYDSVQGVFAYAASLGYDLHITEMGIPAPFGANGLVSAADQERQAAQYRALVRAFILGGGPRAKSISTWGTTDVNAFDPGGLLFDVNGNKKAAYHAVLDVLNQ